MAKDILLFGHFEQWQSLFFFNQLNEATKENPSEEFVLRINSEGGDPETASTIIAKSQEIIEQVVAVKGHSKMHSTALFLLAYFPVEKCECLDTTQALLHRACYPDWLESSPGYKGSPIEQISIKANKDLEKAFRARVDVAALEALPQLKEKNITLKSIFDLTTRIEVVLTGADLKKIGLVSRVVKITPTKAAAINAELEIFKKCDSLGAYKLAAMAITKENETETDDTQNPNTMTLAELKAKFPAVYAEAKGEGVAEEKDRVESILTFNDIDPVGVKAAIESGKPMTAKQMAEFGRKQMNAAVLTNAAADSAGTVETETNVDEEEQVAAQTAADGKKPATPIAAAAAAKPKPLGEGKKPKDAAKQKELETFEAALDASLGLKKVS